MKTIPYWTDNTPFPKDISSGDLPGKVDVAVVGSGYTGLNAALVMVKAGLNVAVFEKEKVGWGASSRNGGLIGSGLSLSIEDMEARYGKSLAQAFWRWSIDALDYIDEIIKNEKISCDFARSGEIVLATKPSHFEGLTEHHEYLIKEYGDESTELITRAELEKEIGSSIYFGGMLEKGGAGLDPAKFVYGLARAVKRNGGQIFEKAEVKRIDQKNGRFSLSTEIGEVKAGDVLIATNGYTTNLIPKIRYGIFSGACYTIVTEPLSPEMQEIISPNGRVFYDSRYFLNYFRVLADGRMLIGGRKTMAYGQNLEISARELKERLVEIFPQLKDIEVTHCWTGRLGLTLDQMPHLGLANGIYYAYGYMGHGVPIGSYLGHEVGQMIAGQRDHSIFMDIKHPRSFITMFDKLYMPIVSTYFRFMDTIK